MIRIASPCVALVIGEGGSGGALGVGVADKVCVLENAYYSVISPEGCAAILWKDGAKARDAAATLKLTAQDLLGMGIIDEIIPEPLGGAHRDPQATAQAVKASIQRHLSDLEKLSPADLLRNRYAKFRSIGCVAGGQ
jgi:acetyl-CoA carboxylase carboxyl transferase subunit alpha